MGIVKATEEQGSSARAYRRYTQGTCVSVDKISHTLRVNIGETDGSGAPIYLEGVPYSPQNPPSPGDVGSLGYTSPSPRSVFWVGGRLGGGNSQDSITVVGGVSSLRKAGESSGIKGDIILAPGTNVTLIRTGQTFTINCTAGGAPATSAPPAISSTGALGTDTGHFALADHTHAGVHAITGPSASALGDIVLQGAGVTQSGNTFTFPGAPASASSAPPAIASSGSLGSDATHFARADHTHSGVHAITGPSASALGDVVFQGPGVTQSGNTFTFAGSGVTGIQVRRGESGTLTNVRGKLTLIEGANIAIAVADDSIDGDVDVTISATGSGGGPGSGDANEFYTGFVDATTAGSENSGNARLINYNTNAMDTGPVPHQQPIGFGPFTIEYRSNLRPDRQTVQQNTNSGYNFASGNAIDYLTYGDTALYAVDGNETVYRLGTLGTARRKFKTIQNNYTMQPGDDLLFVNASGQLQTPDTSA